MKIIDYLKSLFKDKTITQKYVEKNSVDEIIDNSNELIIQKDLSELIFNLGLNFKSIEEKDSSFCKFKKIIKSDAYSCNIKGYKTDYSGFEVEYYVIHLPNHYATVNHITILLLHKDNEIVFKRTTPYTIETIEERILKDFRSVIKSYSKLSREVLDLLSEEFKKVSNKIYGLDSPYELIKSSDLRCLKKGDLYTLRSNSYVNVLGIQQNYKNYRESGESLFEKNNWNKIGQSDYIGCFNEKNINKYAEKNLRIKNNITFDGKIDASTLISINDSKKEYIEIKINDYIFYIINYSNIVVFFEIKEIVDLDKIENIYNDSRIKILKKIEVNIGDDYVIFKDSIFEQILKSKVHASSECIKEIYNFLIKYSLSKKDRESIGVSSDGVLSDEEVEMVNLLVY